MSIRLRLTLLYSLILAVTLTGFSAASYVTVAQDGYQRLVDTLASKALRIVAEESFRLDDIEDLAYRFAGPEVYVQTRDTDGALLARSSSLGDHSLPLSDQERGDPADDGAWVDTVTIAGEQRLVYNRPILHQADPVGLLQVSNSLADRNRSLDTLARWLVVGNLLALVAAVGAGWLLAGIGLRPIYQLAQAVLAIGRTRDFARRVGYRGADNEIGQLARTFDQMLTELEDAHRQTERALQAQERFVADASHELRTPLTTVRGNLELLRREPPITDSDRLAVLTDLLEESDRLIRMVNDLLVLARADGEPPQWQEPVPLQPVLTSVERQVRQLAPARSITFQPIAQATGELICVLGNEDALKQVLLILLDNALKHTPPSAQISLGAVAANGYVEISVSDTGPGIPAAELPRVFDRFYVVDTARTANSTGLGLAIAKSLVESQRGRIRVVSADGQGTTFEVRLQCGT